MSKREKWLVGVSVVVFAAVVFLIIQGRSKFVLPKTQKEKVREQVDNMLLRDPEVPLERKAEIVADRAATAVDITCHECGRFFSSTNRKARRGISEAQRKRDRAASAFGGKSPPASRTAMETANALTKPSAEWLSLPKKLQSTIAKLRRLWCEEPSVRGNNKTTLKLLKKPSN